MSATYWRSQDDDEAMQDEHRFLWDALVETIDADLEGTRVLDIGCNQGGFLRLLLDRAGSAEGFGYDPASAAIEDARRLAGSRPLHFEAAATVPDGWGGFDVAFSHEVLYLLEDLPSHAATTFGALRPGGVYYATMGVHAASPLMAAWHAANAEEMGLPRLYDPDDVVAAFTAAGFDVAAGRLALRFVPAPGGGHHGSGRLVDWLDYYTEQKLIFRLARPAGT